MPFLVSTRVTTQVVWYGPEVGTMAEVEPHVSVVRVESPLESGVGVGVGCENGVAVGIGVPLTRVGGGVDGNVPKLWAVGASRGPRDVKYSFSSRVRAVTARRNTLRRTTIASAYSTSAWPACPRPRLLSFARSTFWTACSFDAA